MILPVYLREASASGRSSIFINTKFCGKVVRIYINETISPDNWDKKSQRSTNNPYLNAYIDDIVVRVYGVLNKYAVSNSKDIEAYKREARKAVKMQNTTPLLDYIKTDMLIRYQEEVGYLDTYFFAHPIRINRYTNFLVACKLKQSKILHELLTIRSQMESKGIGYDTVGYQIAVDRVK